MGTRSGGRDRASGRPRDWTAGERHDRATAVQDMTGETSRGPQREARGAMRASDPGDRLVRETEHGPNPGDVPKGIVEQATAKARERGDDRYRSGLRTA